MDQQRLLPHRENAIVGDEKLGYYIDEVNRGRRGSKVGIFRDALGFTEYGPLRDALVSHAKSNRGAIREQRRDGAIWNVDGPMTGPSGRTMRIRSGWMIDRGSNVPRNTTAFPGPREAA